MFLSREEREERKRKEEKKNELSDQIEDLKDSIEEKRKEATAITNEHIAQNAGKWEYLELTINLSLLGGKNEVQNRGGL